MFHAPDKYRLKNKTLPVFEGMENNGAFLIPYTDPKSKFELKLQVVASDGMGWEHVSVSIHKKDRTPTWDEMCYIKNLFWDEEDTVLQFHPPKKDYINNHPNCLHLWRPTDMRMPVPDKILVGLDEDTVKNLNDIIYNSIGVLTSDQQEEKQRVADNMERYGGSFVKQLGKMVRTADYHNWDNIKRVWSNYYEEYKNWGSGEEDQ